MSNWLNRRERVDLYHAQDGLCSCCTKPLPALDKKAGQSDPKRISVDHTVSRNRGGISRLGNFTLMHAVCNEWKGDWRPTGCEIIWLFAVNARMGLPERSWWVGPLVRLGLKVPLPSDFPVSR